ncbi:MAG: SpoIID/LytB domain-containing protein [Coriobacteriia bacterium]|nr:SpoIID/LytB domain-containing protein [Coriobacteriia bacterium]
MSQYGAKGFAVQGWTHDRIMAHYFRGTTIATVAERAVTVNLSVKKLRQASWTIRSGWTGSTLSLTGALITAAAPSGVATTVAAPADHRYTFTGSGTSIVVRDIDATGLPVIGTFRGALKVRTRPVTGKDPITQVVDKTGPWNSTYQAYRGDLVLDAVASSVRLLNVVGVEGYLKGVVPRESPSSWPAEALRAQAIAARSYALTSSGELYCDTHSQMYTGFGYGAARTYLGAERREADTSNAAVDATKGEVVMYGATMVKTYFSSCAGGHTASIQDVWLTAVPKPYYVGVDSPDVAGGSPNGAQWTQSGSTQKFVYSGTALADKFKGYRPSTTAYVSAVSVARAPSQFATNVTVTWSNGSKTVLTAEVVRSLLGLKSTKFFIASNVVPTPANRIEQSSARVVRTRTWYTVRAGVHSGGSYAYAKVLGAKLAVPFTGTGVAIVGPRYANFGRMNVYVDGRYLRTVSQYAAKPAYRQILYRITGLASAPHTVTVSYTGTKDARSKGRTVGVDGFDILP